MHNKINQKFTFLWLKPKTLLNQKRTQSKQITKQINTHGHTGEHTQTRKKQKRI